MDWPLFEDECYLDSVWHSAWTTKELWMGSSSFFSSAVFFAAASSSSAGALNSTSLLTSSALPSVALKGLQRGEPSYSFADFVFGRMTLLLLNTVGEGVFVLSLFVNNGSNSQGSILQHTDMVFSLNYYYYYYYYYYYLQKYVVNAKLCVKVQQRFFSFSSRLLIILLWT